MKRNISGIHFRVMYNGKWDNVCFEELTEAQQREVTKDWSEEQLRRLVMKLAQSLNIIGEEEVRGCKTENVDQTYYEDGSVSKDCCDECRNIKFVKRPVQHGHCKINMIEINNVELTVCSYFHSNVRNNT